MSIDVHGLIQTANQACAALLDCAVEELPGLVAYLKPGSSSQSTPVISLHRARAGHLGKTIFQRVLENQDYLYQECIVIGKKGRSVPVLLAASKLQDEQGTLIGYVGVATDITALKSAQEQAYQQNRAFNTFFDGALDMHCISDTRGKISKINYAFQQALGYSETELLAIPFLQLIHPHEQPFVYQQLLMHIDQQPVRNQINQLRKKDGTYRVIEWNAIAIDGVVYGSAHDITQRQQSETQLRHLSQRLQLATQAAGQGIWETDYERDQLIWDDRLWEIHGLKPGRTDWTLQDYLSLIHPDDLPAFMARFDLDSQKDTLWNQVRIRQPSGAIRKAETKGILIRDQQGGLVRGIGVMWDVTDRMLAQEALRESEQRFREIADNVDEVFWIHSVEPFELLYINSAYERVFGIASPPGPVDTASWLNSVLAEDQAMVKAEFNHYRQGQAVTLQCRVQGTHPEIRWLQIRTFIIKDSQGHPVRYIGIANDVTGQKEKELVLLTSLQREQALNELKSQFVSTASHEFRTPLTTIQSSVDLLTLYLDLPPTRARASIEHHLAVIQTEITKFSTLLTDLLTIGKIDAGKLTFSPQWTDLVALSKGVIKLHFKGHLFDARSVDLCVEGTPRPVYVDATLLSHVLVNLLTNAFKYSSDGWPCLRLVFNDTGLVLTVSDTGIGIPAGDLPNLFKAFFRASNTVGIQGTGLGLVIARQFVKLHRGQLEVESQENNGTTFTIRLPSEPGGPPPGGVGE